jgi:hypothetical protein
MQNGSHDLEDGVLLFCADAQHGERILQGGHMVIKERVSVNRASKSMQSYRKCVEVFGVVHAVNAGAGALAEVPKVLR